MSTIESVLTENRSFPPPASFAANANVSGMPAYQALCDEAAHDFEGFWARQARTNLLWHKPFTRTLDESNAPFFKWFPDGELNASYNCLDRHLETQPDKTAIIFEADDGKVTRITYQALHTKVCQFANGLKTLGLKKGDRVIIYMPMSIEVVIAMQACARLGLTHSVVFGGFSAKSLQERIIDAGAVAVITADGGMRGGREVPLKSAVDEAFGMGGCESVQHVVVYKRTGSAVHMQSPRDKWWDDVIRGQGKTCDPVWVDAEHPLFILYTSGSTGKPKGVQHSTGGYLLWSILTMQWVFDHKPTDVFWCTADVGWVTGHSYACYGPLAVGATEIIFEGVPTYPDAGRFWKMIETHKVSIFYTAPTAIRSLIKAGHDLPKKYDLRSLRLLGSVGEPINPEAWMWYHTTVGGGRCPIVDTWWQTETGGILITPLPALVTQKPGSATRPFPGIAASVVDDHGNPVEKGKGGYLVITRPWPGMFRTLYQDDERYVSNYFSRFDVRTYFPGDGARQDEDGDFWLLGRVDDVMNVSGHRLSTIELESTLVEHPAVAEAAATAAPDSFTGQTPLCFVLLRAGYEPSDELAAELREWIGQKIGKIARPKAVIIADDLPKTRSGKIMRRLLKDIAEGHELGDTTTLRDPAVVDDLKRRADEILASSR